MSPRHTADDARRRRATAVECPPFGSAFRTVDDENPSVRYLHARTLAEQRRTRDASHERCAFGY
jgi:hypothetical protein